MGHSDNHHSSSPSKKETKKDLENKICELKSKLGSLSDELQAERSSDYRDDIYRRKLKDEAYWRYRDLEPNVHKPSKVLPKGSLPKGFDSPKTEQKQEQKQEQEQEQEKPGGIKVKHLIGIGIMAMIAIVATTIIFVPVTENTQSNIVNQQSGQEFLDVQVDHSMNGIAKAYPNIQDFVKAVDNGALDYDKLPPVAQTIYDKQRGIP